LKAGLDDSSIPDDIKAKQHQQHLNRFLLTARQLPVTKSETLIDFKTPSVDDLIGLETKAPKKDQES